MLLTLNVLWLLLRLARAGAALRLWDVFERRLNMFATALPGGLQTDDAGDLLAHDELLHFSCLLVDLCRGSRIIRCAAASACCRDLYAKVLPPVGGGQAERGPCHPVNF